MPIIPIPRSRRVADRLINPTRRPLVQNATHPNREAITTSDRPFTPIELPTPPDSSLNGPRRTARTRLGAFWPPFASAAPTLNVVSHSLNARRAALILWALLPATSSAQHNVTPPRADRLCLILATTTRHVTNPGDDLDLIEGVFKQGVESVNSEGTATVELGQPLKAIGIHTKKELFDLVDCAVEVADEATTLVCYLKLHGHTNNAGLHVMQLDAFNGAVPEEVTNNDIIARIKEAGKSIRLTILITESCSIANFEPTKVTAANRIFPTRLFDDLFLKAQGTTNLNSSSLNQAAWMDERGAIFTRVFERTFTLQGKAHSDMLGSLPKTSDGRYTWKGFTAYLSHETSKEFAVFKKTTVDGVKNGTIQMFANQYQYLMNQTDQFPEHFSLAD